jgi:hypothetical protein
MLHAYNYHTGQGISIMSEAGGFQLLGEDTEEENRYYYECGANNVCFAKDEVTRGAFRELQAAINRAIVQFPAAGISPIPTDGDIGPATLVAAWRLARHIGPDVDPIFEQISAVDIMDADQVGPSLAWLLAGSPIQIKDAFDSVTLAAASQGSGFGAKHHRTVWTLGIIGITLGAVGSAVYFGRKH